MATTAFDFSAVSVETAELPKNGAGRPRTRKENPFTEVLAQSYEDFQNDKEAGRSITVPGKNVAEAVYLIRQASDDLSIGARIVTQHKGVTVPVKDCKDLGAKMVQILFAGKDRRKASENADGASEPESTESA